MNSDRRNRSAMGATTSKSSGRHLLAAIRGGVGTGGLEPGDLGTQAVDAQFLDELDGRSGNFIGQGYIRQLAAGGLDLFGGGKPSHSRTRMSSRAGWPGRPGHAGRLPAVRPGPPGHAR